MSTADKIVVVCREVEQMLLDKNAAYGDSASNPLRVFSKADRLEGIRVRIDDKLSRIQNGTSYPGDNDVRDLVGYLLLYLVNDGTEMPVVDHLDPPWGSYRDSDGDLWTRALDGRYFMGEGHREKGAATLEYLSCQHGPLVPAVA